MKRKHVRWSGIFLWKSCNANGRISQGLMAAPDMIQNTPWYSNDHLSYQNVSETTWSVPRFFKNNIFPNSMKAVPGKMRKKDTKLTRLSIQISKRVKSNYMGKRQYNILSFGSLRSWRDFCTRGTFLAPAMQSQRRSREGLQIDLYTHSSCGSTAKTIQHSQPYPASYGG